LAVCAKKLLQRNANHIKTILIPKANERDLEEIPEHWKEGIKFISVSNAEQVDGSWYSNSCDGQYF